MPILRHSVPRILVALLALLVFSGDVLDDVWTPAGSTPSHSSQPSTQQKGGSPKNGSASHDDTVALSARVGLLIPALPTLIRYLDIDEAAPDGAPPAIDHPPQLA